MPRVVLAIDPGRSKCGLAVVTSSDHPLPNSKSFDILHQSVVSRSDIKMAISSLIESYSPCVIIIGDGTSSSQLAQEITELNFAKVEFVDEKFTSIAARKRFFIENPPRGFRKLIPTSFQTPSRPYDDYVAVILAEIYLSTSCE